MKDSSINYMLTKEQLDIVDYQLCDPKSTIYNSYALLRLNISEYDMDKIANSICKTIKNHKAMLTTYSINEDGDIIQKYNPNVVDEIIVEKISEFEFSQIKDNLVIPFKLIDSKMYRCRVFQTEKYGYIFIDVHHSLFDGNSLNIFIENVLNDYHNNSIEEDNYYQMLDEYSNNQQGEPFKEAQEYFETKYNRDEWSVKPAFDHNSKRIGKSILKSVIDIEEGKISDIENDFKINIKEFLLTALLITTSIYNNKDNIKISWIYNERDQKKYKNTVGFLSKILPVALKITNDKNLEELYKDVHEQVNKGIKYCNFPCIDNQDDTLYFTYIKNEQSNNNKLEIIENKQNQFISKSNINIEISGNKDALEITTEYSSNKYKSDSIETYIELLSKVINIMVSKEELTIKDIKNSAKLEINILSKVANIFK